MTWENVLNSASSALVDYFTLQHGSGIYLGGGTYERMRIRSCTEECCLKSPVGYPNGPHHLLMMMIPRYCDYVLGLVPVYPYHHHRSDQRTAEELSSPYRVVGIVG